MSAYQMWLCAELEAVNTVMNPEATAAYHIVDSVEKSLLPQEHPRRWQVCGKMGDRWHMLVTGVWPIQAETLKGICEDPRVLAVYDAVQAFFRDHDGSLKLAFTLVHQEEFDIEIPDDIPARGQLAR